MKGGLKELRKHKKRGVIILDFGSQYTQLIARRIREAGVYCEIHPYDIAVEDLQSKNPGGVILSGGPSSVYEKDAPQPNSKLLEEINCPILGICYGFQLLAAQLGGEVKASDKREYGHERLNVSAKDSPLFSGLPNELDVWLSHGDKITQAPPSFREVAWTSGALNAFEDLSRCIFGIQFHPEVAHTQFGSQIIQNFLFRVCRLEPTWTTRSIIAEQIENIQNEVGEGKAICGLSGGVDSTVAAALVHKAIGRKQLCLFINNGFLRDGEFEAVLNLYKERMDLNVKGLNASDKFIEALSGVIDPEKKRKIIGHIFIELFEKESEKLDKVDFLVQGTLYPDVIESHSVKGPSSVIKSHHNVGGLPEKMKLKLIEPLRDLFKDEVRALGRELGVPAEIYQRHPFPGPGLAVRIIGEITHENLRIVRSADRIIEEELKLYGVYENLWQAFPVLLPVFTVGVMGDLRTYERVIALRAITSTDGMTADWARLPHDLLARISSRIVSEVRGINRVVFDISSKPPSTIEWE